MAVYAALTPFIRNTSMLLDNFDIVIPPTALEISKFALKEFKSFRDFVERLDSRSRKRMNASLQQIAEAIRKWTISVDEGDEATMRELHSLVEQFQKVKEEYYTLLREFEEGIASSSSSSSTVVSKTKMVGLRDKLRLLKEDLISPSLKETFYSLTGMAGIGKTAVAREIFEDLDILEWFDCRAWVTVGLKYKSEKITEAILVQVAPELCKMIMGVSEEILCVALQRCLKGKRYLIVLDDVWSENVYEYLDISLPNNKNGSRVLVVSRMKKVSYTSTKDFHHSYMRLLDEEESWDLLREKAFAGDSCPPHLEEAGKKIAQKCDGLPLTILTVADSLSKAEESLWFDVASKKKHQLFIDAYDQISKVLYPSYDILSDNSKVLFLYMGVFLLKYEIPKSRLINLWIVEDFVVPCEFRTLEYSAVKVLKFLDSCNIVMVCQRDITAPIADISGNVKSCRLHSS